MTSRRPMNRSYSGNGRSGSQNGEDVPSPRLDSRNYLSNVRPENRSTLCTVMAQLTEETQPCFEMTLKSKAVSETCNVKFSCVVTGYPVPELTWYKDDMELDRYCGLPKYEIFRNGKTHTLHIYNCTVDDAAIYQASARNSKGIVSCSGVLEVGAMNEYKIHQRFFAKLKQKAELKRRELEESRRRGKENIEHEHLAMSQERFFRKRRLPEGPELSSLSAVQDGEENEAKVEVTIEEKPAVVNEELNGLSMETHEFSNINQENDSQQLNHVYDKEDTNDIKQATKEKVSRKKIKISNGFDEVITNQANQDSGGGGEMSEGMSLAKYLARSLQSQVAKEQLKTLEPGSDTGTVQEKEGNSIEDLERVQMKAEERERERERSREREREKPKQHEFDQSTSESEQHHKSAISSVFHSLKGIFFGKSKKSSETTDASKKFSDASTEKEPKEQCHPPQVQTQTQELCTPSEVSGEEQSVVMEVDQPNQTENLYVNKEFPKQPPHSLQFKTETVDLNEHIHGFNTDKIWDISSTLKPNYDAQVSSFQGQADQESTEEKGALKTPWLPLNEATDDHTEGNTDEDVVDLPHETAGQECPAPMDQVTQADREIHAIEKGEDIADLTQKSKLSLTGPNATDLESTESCPEGYLSQPVSHAPLVPSKHENEGEPRIGKNETDCDLHQKDAGAPVVNNATETETGSVLEMQEGYSLIKGSEVKDEMDVAMATDLTEKTVVMAESAALSSHENMLQCPTHFRDEPILEPETQEIDNEPNKNSIPTVVVDFVKNEQQIVAAVADSAIDDKRMKENSSVESGAAKVDRIEGKIKIEDNKEEKQGENTEERRTDIIEKNGDACMRERKVTSERASSNIIEDPENSIRDLENEVIETNSNLNIVEKPKIFTKVTPERYMESRDQSVAPPIIILPDTRETVIKNVAKMRAVIPEIKVTASDKVKREETISVPRIDALVSEPERVMQPLAQEVAHIFRDNEPKPEEPTNDAKRTPSEFTRDERVLNVVQSVGANLTSQQERNVSLSPSEQRNQEVKPQTEESREGHTDQGKISSGWNRGNDSSSIPIISIACAEDVTPQEGQVHGIPIYETVLPDNAASKMQVCAGPSSTTHIDSTSENRVKPEMSPDSLAAILRKVESEIALSDSSNRSSGIEKPTLPKEQNISDKKNLETPTSTDFPAPLSAKTSDVEPEMDKLQRDKPAMEKLGLTTPVGPTLPPLSPASLRRLMAKNNPNLENQGSVSAISADGSEKKGEESGGSTPTSTLSCESSPKMKRRDSLTLIPSATPEELASGARRKIYLAKTKSEDEGSETQNKRDSPKMSPSQARRAAFLQLQSGQQTPPMERRSPLLGRRKASLEVPKPKQETSEETEHTNSESKPAEKEKSDPFKAPQVIRKIRGEPFSDASGHLKLWCQFFNVLSDSTIKWFKDEEEIAEMKRSAGDESQVALAVVQASSKDCGVYGCTIKNKYGTDTTDYLLSEDILAEFFLRDDLEVGEEIEMTPLLFTKGLADPGYWGDKFFGRIMTQEVQIGQGWTHKTSRAKVIYGLDPVFESGSTCIAKVRNPVAYGTKEESNLVERNLEVTKQECKIQNTVREYCKIFAAESRVIDNFGFSLEVIPLYLMYRPANTIPYATVEAYLNGDYLKYCLMDNSSRLISQTSSEVEQKCCTFQHWIHQWTNGNLLVTQLEGVDTKITNIRIASKCKGYQGLTDEASPKLLEQFMTQHQCNYYCGLLGLRPLKLTDSLQQPKVKTSKSPLLARKVGAGSSSPQLQKKAASSPQPARKGNSSPKVPKKTSEDGESKPATKHKTVEVPKAVRMR